MSGSQSDDDALDRAYTDGKLVGFLGWATSAGCPFADSQTDLRIAWLDGFAYGTWQSSANAGGPDHGPACGGAGAGTDAPGQGDRSVADIAIAHLFRLSKCMKHDVPRGGELGSALEAAAAFSLLVRLARPDQGGVPGPESESPGAIPS
jgi:hypothetical protein